MSKHSFFHDKTLAIAYQTWGVAMVPISRNGRRIYRFGMCKVLVKGTIMTTLCFDSTESHQSHPVAFHLDIAGGVSAAAFAIAMLICLQHGDIAAIPALVCLAVMVFIVHSVHTPPATSYAAGRRRDGANRTTCSRTYLWRRHSLGQ